MQIPSILIIDDEQELCILLESFLSKKSRAIDHSTSLQDGFKKFSSMQPDVLILDHNLPDGHGIENIHRFKDMKNSLRVVIISAMSNLRTEALEKGADFFLEKPISFKELSKIINPDHGPAFHR
jgi:DNA-binding response OmpR family regulator